MIDDGEGEEEEEEDEEDEEGAALWEEKGLDNSGGIFLHPTITP